MSRAKDSLGPERMRLVALELKARKEREKAAHLKAEYLKAADRLLRLKKEEERRRNERKRSLLRQCSVD